MPAMTTAEHLLDDLATNGGGTYSRYGAVILPFRPKSGYAVAYDGVTIPYRPAEPGHGGQIEFLLRKIAKEHDAGEVGTWLDGDTVYIDAVYYFMPGDAGYRAAIEYAWNLGQKAIYDFEQRRSILITDTLYEMAYNVSRGLEWPPEDRQPGQEYDS